VVAVPSVATIGHLLESQLPGVTATNPAAIASATMLLGGTQPTLFASIDEACLPYASLDGGIRGNMPYSNCARLDKHNARTGLGRGTKGAHSRGISAWTSTASRV
jgi:hypothetical protein